MRNRGLKETCRFCIKGNACRVKAEEMHIKFPIDSYGYVIPNDELDAMGVELNKRHKCFEAVYTGVRNDD